MDVKLLSGFPVIRGPRVARMTEKPIGNFVYDSQTATDMVQENLAVFIGNCRDMRWLREGVSRLAECDDQNEYIAIITTKVSYTEFYKNSGVYNGPTAKGAPAFWKEGAVIYSTPEGLRDLVLNGQYPEKPACLLVIDPYGTMPFAQGFGGNSKNSRPKKVVSFQNHLEQFGERPPIIYLTPKRAKSLSTDSMLGPLALNGWWFVDGNRLRIGPPAETCCNTN